MAASISPLVDAAVEDNEGVSGYFLCRDGPNLLTAKVETIAVAVVEEDNMQRTP